MTKLELSDWPLHPAPKPTFVCGWKVDVMTGAFALHLSVNGRTLETMEFPARTLMRYSDREEALRKIYRRHHEMRCAHDVMRRLLS